MIAKSENEGISLSPKTASEITQVCEKYLNELLEGMNKFKPEGAPICNSKYIEESPYDYIFDVGQQKFVRSLPRPVENCEDLSLIDKKYIQQCQKHIEFLNSVLTFFLNKPELTKKIIDSLNGFLSKLPLAFQGHTLARVCVDFQKVIKVIFILCTGLHSGEHAYLYQLSILSDDETFTMLFNPKRKKALERFKFFYSELKSSQFFFAVATCGACVLPLYSLFHMVALETKKDPFVLMARAFYNKTNMAHWVIHFELFELIELATMSGKILIPNKAGEYLEHIKEMFFKSRAEVWVEISGLIVITEPFESLLVPLEGRTVDRLNRQSFPNIDDKTWAELSKPNWPINLRSLGINVSNEVAYLADIYQEWKEMKAILTKGKQIADGRPN